MKHSDGIVTVMLALCLCTAQAQDIAVSSPTSPTSLSNLTIPSSQTPPPLRLQYRLSGTAGWLNRDDKIAGTQTMQGLTMDRPVVLGGTAAVEFLPTQRLRLGRRTGNPDGGALQQWNNASIGVAVTYLNLGQDRYLGNAVATWTYLSIPLVHTPHFIFGLRPGVGLAFADRRYANTVPDAYRWQAYNVDGQQVANISIGSVVNAFINGGLYMDFPIRDGWAVTLAGGWQHLSNGSVLTPNGGYNMFNAEVGVAYTPHAAEVASETPETAVPRRLWDGVDKRWDVELSAAGGVRSVYYRDRGRTGNPWLFGVADVSLAAHWIPLSIFKLGLGVDMFYDGAYAAVCDEFGAANPDAPQTFFGKTYLSESRVDNCFRLGVSLQPEFTVGRLSVGYHVGFYVLDPVKNLEPYKEVAANGGQPLNRGLFYAYDPTRASTYQDGWCYQRLTLKYLVTDHLFVQLGLKLHIMKAEFVAAGLGVRI